MTGSGTLLDPYVIWDVNDLQDMNLDLAAYYELGQDIDASATVGWNLGAGFIPINGAGFTGHFDGKDYTISDLFINRPATNGIGLFGYAHGSATIQNVKLVSVNIHGEDNTGALVGLGLNGVTISNCSATGVVIGNNDIGGLLGYIFSVVAMEVSDCWTSCAVTSDAVASPVNHVGGFAGYVGGVTLQFNRCHATGNVTAPGESVGGFIGYGTAHIASQCFATGAVDCGDDGGDSFAGGFVGFSSGTNTNCYARGNVTATGDYVGGYSGVSPSNMTNCYSTGHVTGVGADVGGLNGNLGGIVTNCFWDIETSGMLVSAGGTGKTTAQMKTESTFTDAGWDFVTIWDITPGCNNDYPCLLNVTPSCGVPVVPFVINKSYALAREEL